jgi:hypothetical protein
MILKSLSGAAKLAGSIGSTHKPSLRSMIKTENVTNARAKAQSRRYKMFDELLAQIRELVNELLAKTEAQNRQLSRYQVAGMILAASSRASSDIMRFNPSPEAYKIALLLARALERAQEFEESEIDW